MSLVAVDFPEDQRIVVAEVVVHLREVGRRQILDGRGLADAWMQVHHCDSAVLDALEPAAHHEYRSIVAGPCRRELPARGRSNGSAVRVGAAHLRVAVHRRLMVLQLVLNETAPEVAGRLGRGDDAAAPATG